MSSICYGIRRLLLLNTVSYSVGDFPLDRPLSISAPNNRGKSTAINALQFPFLSNMNDMSFPRSNEDTKKYYFPYDNSFVVSEIVTETGIYVVGAAGKGQASGYDYQLFAYQSKLDISNFLVNDPETGKGQVRNYKELKTHLAKRDVWVKSLSPKQMRDALMGKNITLANDEKFTIGVFRLRSMTDENYRLFIRVFKNLLHLNKVNLEEMKRLLIDVLLPGEGSNTVDFMVRYSILNEDVEKAKTRVETAVNIEPYVNDLAAAKKSRDQAYGILRALFTSIVAGYKTEKRQREKVITDLSTHIASIDPGIVELKDSQAPLQEKIKRKAVKQDQLKKKLKAIATGEIRFKLYGSIEQRQQQINSMQTGVDQLTGELQRTHPGDILGIRTDLERVKQQINNLAARMSAVDNNLLFVLTRRFEEPQIQRIAKLLNRDLLASLPLGTNGIEVLDEKQLFTALSDMLSRCRNNWYDDGRIRINLDKLEPIVIDDYFNVETIKEKLGRLEKQRSRYERDLEVASDYKNREQERNALHGKIRKAEQDLKDYQKFLSEKERKAEYEKKLADITLTLETAETRLKTITDNILALEQEKQSLSADKMGKESALTSLKERYSLVRTVSEARLVGTEPDHRLPSRLEEMIDTYLVALGEKDKNEEQIRKNLEIIEARNGLCFTSGKEEETTIHELVEAIEGMEEYCRQHENCQKAGSQEIGALLKGLTDRLDRFIREIRKFNRLMNSRKISNINRIEFVVDDNNDILRAVKEIVNQDSIFSNPENVHRAVRQLDELVTRKNVTLSLENLFNMGIRVELEDGKVSSSFNDANIQSTGTGLTVNIILNVMLLNRLLYMKTGQIVNIPIYIDEAGQIDPANQQTLIDQCLPAGFVPVFASVEAQATADYWIGLRELDRRIYVDQDDWFRLSKLEAAPAEVNDA